MRLEHRTCELIEEKESTKVYKLKCTLREAFQLKPYIIEEEAVALYHDTGLYWQEWRFKCITEQVGTGVSFKYPNGKEIDCWDEHLTFIIPEYWEKKNLKDGFYEAGEYEGAVECLKNYVRRIGGVNEENIDYVQQNMGGPGDDEYYYLKMLCDIDDAYLANYDSITFKNTEDAKQMITELVPMNVRTYITVEVPKDFKLK